MRRLTACGAKRMLGLPVKSGHGVAAEQSAKIAAPRSSARSGGAFYLRSNGAAAALAMEPPLRSSLPSRPRDFDDFGFTKQLINPISIAETSQRSVSLSAYLRSAKDLSVLGAVKLS